MSFDFLVFVPAAAPRTDDGFRSWYEMEMADAEASGHSSSIAKSAALVQFYGHMREMFTPFNGPDDVKLPDDATQARILRTCEYTFRPNSLLMSFRRDAQDMARAAASTFARAFDLGAYHVSAQYGQAVFPDGTSVWPQGRYPGYGSGKASK
ncbi:hypothetical protein [Aurantiacibacter odishensis]|uniref:hypothetical protein n=1 Tax=Aurantiacibacter odishensis TaxID=1155476 RepID=UPI000E71391F|nr:hypothetical protein [Aurantiacibacter odishensis]